MAFAGFCSTLVGFGIGRFAYTPLIPALIAERWFAASDVLYLGSANLAGYLAGALLARRAARWIPVAHVLRGSMLCVTAACFCGSLPLSVPWYFAWRFATGVSGAAVMVLAAAAIVPHAPAHWRGRLGGLIFTGIGLGVALSGTFVPLLLRLGLAETWWALGALSAFLTAVSWTSWPTSIPAGRHVPMRRSRSPPAVTALIVEYGLNSVALVPHQIFFVDFVTRGLHLGLAVGSRYWILYGLGAMAGPLLTGNIADRIGFRLALRLAFCIQAAAVALPAPWSSPVGLAISSLVTGAFTPGIVPLVLGRTLELLPVDADGQRIAWSRVTTSFALCQAGSAYGFAYLFNEGWAGYETLFLLASGAAVLALLLDLAVGVSIKS